MNKSILLTSVVIGSLLAGCASAPTTPAKPMKTLNSYVSMEDCASIRSELANVSSWEKYYEDEGKYHKGNAIFSNVLTGMSAMLSVASSYYGISDSATEAATLAQTTGTDGNASRQNAEASAKEQAAIAERRKTLEQMLAAYQCK